MANEYLLPVYKELFEEEFNYYDFDKRLKMQKAVYLLQNLYVPMGDYGFHWYRHGPYSQDLQEDMFDERDSVPEDQSEMLREYAEPLGKLHDLIKSEEHGKYDEATWLECVASMRYLQKRVLRQNATKEGVLQKLASLKSHLDDEEANLAAYRLLEETFR